MFLFVVAVFHLVDRGCAAARRSLSRRGSSSGQATAEYALVLLGAAALALLLGAWAARSGKVGELFDAVTDRLIADAG